MGNCQAAEAATVVIQHPGNKIERIYLSVTANEVMNSNPGHYVAMVVTSPTLKSQNGSPLKQLKLLRPDDTLLIGHVYRLVSFEDVLKEFAEKKSVKLGKLLKKRDENKVEATMKDPADSSQTHNSQSENAIEEVHNLQSNGGSSIGHRGFGRHYGAGVSGQWSPALHSIAEAAGA